MLTGAGDPGAGDTAAAAIAEAERLLRQGEPLLAYNAAAIGLQQFPDQLRLRQLRALALARSGDVERANRSLAELVAAGVDDAETRGVLARTHKDLALAAGDAAERDGHLDAAFQLYGGAYAAARARGATAAAYYTGINAATVAVLRNDRATAQRLAIEVLEVCDADARAQSGAADDFWRRATMGEAALILGRGDEAARHYGAAVALARDRHGDLSSTRRQARVLAAALGVDAAWLGEILRIPPVLVFTGHRADEAGRARARFPASAAAAVRESIRARLAARRPLAVYGSAACGADILCLEAALELGAETHVVLPFPAEEFRRVSVESAPGDWGARFERLLAAATSVTVASDHRASGSAAAFEYANLLLTGMGLLRAQVLETELYGLAVWDEDAEHEAGGSASVVADWTRRGIAVEHVRLAAHRSGAGADAKSAIARPAPTPPSGGAQHAIRALLFADAVGYSRLSEDQIPFYVEGFLQAVADLNARTRHRCEHVETAGDGLYMVFAHSADAAHYALELGALVGGTDWTARGLPADFNLRIALHCGPVYCGRDPITGGPIFTGPHVSRAARIEPITPPGQVYASSAFAAVAAAQGVAGVAWRYVGRIPLAKRSGSLTLYHLHAVD